MSTSERTETADQNSDVTDEDASHFFGPDHRALQDRFGTRKLADRLESEDVLDALGPDEQAFVARAPFFFLTTIDRNRQPTVSYKGGNPGFVSVIGPREIAYPSYDGNGMYYSMGNLAENPKVGLLFIDFDKPNRLRIHGDARVVLDDPLLTAHPGAQFIIRIAIREAFDNCPRYIHRMKITRLSPFAPKPDGSAPRPSWKRLDYIQDTMSEADRAATEAEGGTLDLDTYCGMLNRGET